MKLFEKAIRLDQDADRRLAERLEEAEARLDAGKEILALELDQATAKQLAKAARKNGTVGKLTQTMVELAPDITDQATLAAQQAIAELDRARSALATTGQLAQIAPRVDGVMQKLGVRDSVLGDLIADEQSPAPTSPIARLAGSGDFLSRFGLGGLAVRNGQASSNTTPSAVVEEVAERTIAPKLSAEQGRVVAGKLPPILGKPLAAIDRASATASSPLSPRSSKSSSSSSPSSSSSSSSSSRLASGTQPPGSSTPVANGLVDKAVDLLEGVTDDLPVKLLGSERELVLSSPIVRDLQQTTTEIYTPTNTLSLHDALPISLREGDSARPGRGSASRRAPRRSRGSARRR